MLLHSWRTLRIRRLDDELLGGHGSYARLREDDMTKTVSTDNARQAKPGRPVLLVLISALVLAAVVGVGLMVWGGQAEPTPETTNNAPAQ